MPTLPCRQCINVVLSDFIQVRSPSIMSSVSVF